MFYGKNCTFVHMTDKIFSRYQPPFVDLFPKVDVLEPPLGGRPVCGSRKMWIFHFSVNNLSNKRLAFVEPFVFKINLFEVRVKISNRMKGIASTHSPSVDCRCSRHAIIAVVSETTCIMLSTSPTSQSPSRPAAAAAAADISR